MIEELFRIGSLSISPFGVTLVLALFAAYWHLQRAMRRFGIGDQETASSLIFAAGFVGIVGAKIYYAILYRDWHLLFDRAGIVFYGGFIAGTLAFLWMVHRYRLPLARTVDAAAPGLALGYGVGRVGCFLVGDDYGVPTDLPWGTVFKVGLPPSTAGNLRDHFGVAVAPGIADDAWVAVHPTQLYETLAGLLIWGFALFLMRRDRPPGVIGLSVLALLAVERFLVESLRAKDDRFFGTFTLAQMISLAVLVTVAAIALAAWRRRSAA
jgi:phosphatidylglycerol:prolipoprotein diacylglycerol transferase